jgi:hypothetical protein
MERESQVVPNITRSMFLEDKNPDLNGFNLHFVAPVFCFSSITIRHPLTNMPTLAGKPLSQNGLGLMRESLDMVHLHYNLTSV